MKIYEKFPELAANWKLPGMRAQFALRRALLLISFITVPFLIMAQRIDSLNSLLSNSSGADRTNILYQLAYEYIDIDNLLAIRYATESLALAKAKKDEEGIVRAGIAKSLAFSRIGEEDSSIFLASQILPMAKKNNQTKDLVKILNRLGAAMAYKGQYDKALRYHFESLQIRERNNDKFEISVTLNNIGFIYYQLEDYDKALSHYERSLKLKDEIDNKYDLDMLLTNISLCYIHKGNFAEAREFIEKGLNLCNGDCSKKFLIRAYYNLGLISLRLNRDVEAEKEFLKSFTLAKELADKRLQIDNMFNLLEIYNRSHNIGAAKGLIREAEILSIDKTYNSSAIQLYHEIFQYYEKTHDFKKVALYQGKYIQLKDSVYNEKLTTNLMKVEAEYLERENRARIIAQSEKLFLNSQVIIRQRFLNISIGLTSLLLIALAVIQYRNVVQKKRSNLLLEQKVKERTIKLEENYETLRRAHDECSLYIQRISINLKGALATIRGLCLLGLSDTASNSYQYIERIDKASEELLSGLNRTLTIT